MEGRADLEGGTGLDTSRGGLGGGLLFRVSVGGAVEEGGGLVGVATGRLGGDGIG